MKCNLIISCQKKKKVTFCNNSSFFQYFCCLNKFLRMLFSSFKPYLKHFENACKGERMCSNLQAWNRKNQSQEVSVKYEK